MLSMLVIAFLSRSQCLNFMASVTICSDFGALKNKVSHYFHHVPFHLPWSTDGLWWTGRPGMLQFMGSQRVRHDWATELNWMGRDAVIVVFWRLSFKPLSSFTYIKRLFSFSSLSTIRVVSSAYLRLLIFLLQSWLLLVLCPVQYFERCILHIN